MAQVDRLSSLHSVKCTPSRFTKTSQGRSWNTGNGSPDAICFVADKPGVVLVGVCVYGGGGIHEYELEVLADDVSAVSARQLLLKCNCAAQQDPVIVLYGFMVRFRCPEGYFTTSAFIKFYDDVTLGEGTLLLHIARVRGSNPALCVWRFIISCHLAGFLCVLQFPHAVQRVAIMVVCERLCVYMPCDGLAACPGCFAVFCPVLRGIDTLSIHNRLS